MPKRMDLPSHTIKKHDGIRCWPAHLSLVSVNEAASPWNTLLRPKHCMKLVKDTGGGRDREMSRPFREKSRSIRHMTFKNRLDVRLQMP